MAQGKRPPGQEPGSRSISGTDLRRGAEKRNIPGPGQLFWGIWGAPGWVQEPSACWSWRRSPEGVQNLHKQESLGHACVRRTHGDGTSHVHAQAPPLWGGLSGRRLRSPLPSCCSLCLCPSLFLRLPWLAPNSNSQGEGLLLALSRMRWAWWAQGLPEDIRTRTPRICSQAKQSFRM